MDFFPNTVNEAVAILLSEMSGRDKLVLRNTKKEDLILYNMCWGADVRNKFSLWSVNDSLIEDANVTHPDSISTVIMEAVWEELQIRENP